MKITLRAATKEDCHDLWVWRNHPEVRQWCFDSGEIKYEAHKKWFEDKYEDGDVKFYISLDEHGAKVGQTRFDIKNGRAYINVNLNPESFGIGVGNKIIRLASQLFLSEVYEIKEILAEIMDANILSKKAFEKAGYTHSYDVERNNRKVCVYQYRNA